MWVRGLADPGLHKEFWQHVFCFVLCVLQVLHASELALKQYFLFPKYLIIINDLSFTTSLQGRSVAKHQKHRWRNKRKMLNDVVEIAKRKGNIKARAFHSSYRYLTVSGGWRGFPKWGHTYFLTPSQINPSKNFPPCLHSFLTVSLIPLTSEVLFSLC